MFLTPRAGDRNSAKNLAHLLQFLTSRAMDSDQSAPVISAELFLTSRAMDSDRGASVHPRFPILNIARDGFGKA